ncbi:MAG: hypothetical protein LBT81_00135 [Helicobacteraceae bacterium]|nr:hypothetical protein [Helicobacteraceae bacterium]
MDIKGHIKCVIKYKTYLNEPLKCYDFASFDINESSAACFVDDNGYLCAVSKWVSPKRTRSYPYERVYNTLDYPKRIAVIPIVKDEGLKGDRDFIQWDTVSLMSLLGVYVILSYYCDAVAKNQKITNQKFDNDYIKLKIKEIEECHSSALHWNLEELKNLSKLVEKSKKSYAIIESESGVALHSAKGLDDFQNRIDIELCEFMNFSRTKAQKAQLRELNVIQPKESLTTISKARITISNHLGGLYYFTVDETLVKRDTLFLIESKHTRSAILPSKSDIKDGLLKMILYSNLRDITVSGKALNSVAVLNLTSSKIAGKLSSNQGDNQNFAKQNSLSNADKKLIEGVFEEAQKNGFTVSIRNAQ